MIAHLDRSAGAERQVVHLVGHLNEAVFRLLGPATAALSRTCGVQTVIVVDYAHSRSILSRFDPSVDLVMVAPRHNPVAQWRDLRHAFAHFIEQSPPHAVHLHGYIASLIGEQALGRLGLNLPTFYSPHGGFSVGPLQTVAALAHTLGRSHRHAPAVQAIGHGAAEAKALYSEAHPRVTMIEGPVDRAYFDAVHRPTRHPLLLAASRLHDVRSVEAFDQLAVLLGGDALGAAFNWLGPVDALSAQRLAAANVGVFDTHSDVERATRLAAGWAFLAMGAGRAFPSDLAEAMAVGLPCVALDTAAHRDLVRQGETGYLCRSQAEVIDRVAQLIDTPSLRERMGAAGRADAARRFNDARFQAALACAYDQRSAAGAQAGVATPTSRHPAPTASPTP